MANLFIPKKLKIGFQKRNDTYTGKLAYVIYYDEKNVLRKEKSWTSWCDSSIQSIEVDNLPRSGFVLNKGIQRMGYHWGNGRSVVRVHDSREFEFEITVANLIGILMHSDVSKRDIMEECVFAWQGTELVLLPVTSEEYQKSVTFTAKQSNTVSAKDLVLGYQYAEKKSDTVLTYIGRHNWWEASGFEIRTHINRGKHYIFWDGDKFIRLKELKKISHCLSNAIVDNYAELVENFYSTLNSQNVVGVNIVECPIKFRDYYTTGRQHASYIHKFDDISWHLAHVYKSTIANDYGYQKDEKIYDKCVATFVDGIFRITRLSSRNPNYGPFGSSSKPYATVATDCLTTTHKVMFILKNGKEIEYNATHYY